MITFEEVISTRGVSRHRLTGGAVTVELCVVAALFSVWPCFAQAPRHPAGPDSGAVPPRVVHKVEAQYSDEAQRAQVQAYVLVAVEVGTDGVPRQIKVVRPAGFGLDEKAIQAVEQWQFASGTKDGEPVTNYATIEVSFQLSQSNRPWAQLKFELPSGVHRPRFIKGNVPQGPNRSGEKVRIAFRVLASGEPEQVRVLEATDPEWGTQVERAVQKWRFAEWGQNGPPSIDAEFVATCRHP